MPYYNSRFNKKQESQEVREFPGKVSSLMSEEEKSAPRVPIDILAYDFTCRITRLYKWLNEAKHPQSDADYLSKTSISLKEARETDHWLNLLHDNAYLDDNQFTSLDHDLDRILRILVTITTKVRERLKTS